MIPSLPTIRTNWLESQPKNVSKNHKHSNLCVTGGMKFMVFHILKRRLYNMSIK